ncbi:MAG TPA: DUF481 domain-containing protein [Terriglobales bacterium]|nr:DUF481 domain-containing protein [Terriglobales bacterium]
MRTALWLWPVLSWFAVSATTAWADDEVTARGTTLRGTINRLTGTGVELQPEYGDGVLMVKWKDVENLRSEKVFQILHGDDDAVYSPLHGYRDGKLQLNEATVEVAALQLGLPIAGTTPALTDRLRSTWRYWDGNFDVSFHSAQSTVDTLGMLFAFEATRNKAPTRLITAASYRFGRQESERRNEATGEDETEETTLQDEWRGLVRGEYQITPRFYGLLSGDLQYDAIQSLSLRAVPKLGAGYLVWLDQLSETKRNFLGLESGGAYIYENYFGSETDQYFAVAFGAMAQVHFSFGRFDWRLDYLPSVSDWTGDYLLRTEAGVTIPIIGPLNLRATLTDAFDSSPAEDAEKNSLYVSVGLGVSW